MTEDKAQARARLVRVFGEPSDAAFGSAVFEQPGDGDLETAARASYRHFVGGLWERYGEEAWMGPWALVYRRPAGAPGDIVREIQAIEDRVVRSAAPMLLEAGGDAAAALAGVFDGPEAQEVAVYRIGDGEAISGLLLAGRQRQGPSLFLVLLMD